MKIVRKDEQKIIVQDVNPWMWKAILIIACFPIAGMYYYIRGKGDLGTDTTLFLIVLVAIPIGIDILIFFATRRITILVDKVARTFVWSVSRFFRTTETKTWGIGDLKELRLILTTKMIRAKNRSTGRMGSRVDLKYLFEAINRTGESVPLCSWRVYAFMRYMPCLREIKEISKFVGMSIVVDASEVGADKDRWDNYTKGYMATGVMEQQIEHIKQEVAK